MLSRVLMAMGCVAGLSACGDDAMVMADAAPMACEPARALQGATPLPADIDDVLDAMCRECHGEPLQNFAPMPLLTWEDLQAPAFNSKNSPAVYERIALRIHDAQFPMPPKTRPQLSAAQRSLLDDWIAQCAPPADE